MSLFMNVYVLGFISGVVQTEQDIQRQRSIEAAQLYRQRRHISQDDTLSMNSSLSESDLAHQIEERRVGTYHVNLSALAASCIVRAVKYPQHYKN